MLENALEMYEFHEVIEKIGLWKEDVCFKKKIPIIAHSACWRTTRFSIPIYPFILLLYNHII